MPRKPKTRAPYIMVADTTWDLARADYLGGMTAKQVADKHTIGLHNLRQTMARNGWTKRALAEARAFAGPGGPAVTVPPAAPAAAAEPEPQPWGELLAGVLGRARAALLAGRGGEATALLRAMRDYVLVRQDVADAHDAMAEHLQTWDAAQPARAGELTETLMLQTLHSFWSRLTPDEQAERCDPTGKTGFRKWLWKAAPEVMGGGRKGRR